MLYEVKWTKHEGYSEYEGYSVVEAETEAEAEVEFFAYRKEMNPYKGNFTGYCVESINIYSRA